MHVPGAAGLRWAALGWAMKVRGSTYLPAPGCFTEDLAGLGMCRKKGPNLHVSGDAGLVKVGRELAGQWRSVETSCCSGKLFFIDENIILQDAKCP